MKKKMIFILSAIVWLTCSLRAQEGSPIYLVRYHQTLDFYNDSERQSATWSALNYEGRLYFNTEVSAYYYGQGSDEAAVISDDYNYRILSKDARGYVFFRDQRADLLLSRDFISDKAFIIREPLPRIEWTIRDQYKTIGEYRCQLAVGEFRGRVYEAWFTPDIPVSSGPWKLGGLPGLILEAGDRLHQVRFSFASLSKVPEGPVNWDRPPQSGTPLSYAQFVETRQRKVDEIFENIASMPGVTIQRGSYKGIELSNE